MRIAFELVGDSVGVHDLAESASSNNATAKVVVTATLRQHGPVPVLMAVFEVDGPDRDAATAAISESLDLAGIEVNHG